MVMLQSATTSDRAIVVILFGIPQDYYNHDHDVKWFVCGRLDILTQTAVPNSIKVRANGHLRCGVEGPSTPCGRLDR